MRTLALILFLSVFAAIILAQNTNYTQDPTWKAPPKAAARHNLVAGQPNALTAGKKIFETSCAMCHGPNGEGVANAADLRLPVVQRQSDGTLFWKISNGHPSKGMPAFGGNLSDEQRWQLVAFLRTFKPAPAKGGK